MNCYTCHRGQLRPATVPQIAQTTAPPPAPPAKSSEPLPTVDQALAKYVQALGGKEALEKLTTRRGKGVFEAGPMRIPLETFEKAPNKSVMIGRFPNGQAARGYDGTSGWEQNPGQAPRTATGESLQQLKDDSEFYQGLRLNDLYTTLAVKGKEKVGDAEAWVVEAVAGAGETDRIYFDAASGLLVRKLKIHDTPLGSLPSQIGFEDYRPVGGVRLPFLIRQSRPDVTLTMRFEEIEANIPIDDGKFTQRPLQNEAPAQPRVPRTNLWRSVQLVLISFGV